VPNLIDAGLTSNGCVTTTGGLLTTTGYPCGSGSGNVSGSGVSNPGHFAMFNNSYSTAINDTGYYPGSFLQTTRALSELGLTGYLYSNGADAATASTSIPYSALSGAPVVSLGDSDLTNQTASLTATTLVAAAPQTGKYRISYYADQNALCASGAESVQFNFQWTDGAHARNVNTVALVLPSSQSANLGSIQGMVPIFAAVGTSITFTSTTYGACSTGGPASYDVHISVESVT
jgi:hypothetical protein